MNNIHKDDINSVDWSKTDPNYVVTGSSDCEVNIIDIRKISSQSSSGHECIAKKLI